MFVTPLPSQGDSFVGRDAVGRTLRVSAHPEQQEWVADEGQALAG